MPSGDLPTSLIEKSAAIIHHYFIAVLLAAYGLAATLPGFGMWLRSVDLGTIPSTDKSVSPILVLLAVLLFNAGLGIKKESLLKLLRMPSLLLSSLSVAYAIPFLLVSGMALVDFGMTPEIKIGILVGLASALTMPAANSSAGWSQNCQGNVTFSVSFIVCGTLLSAIFTPLILRSLTWPEMGSAADALRQLAAAYSGIFVLLWVLLPTSCGYLSRVLVGAKTVQTHASSIKLINYAVIVLLNYANGAVSLPHVLSYFDLPGLLLFCLLVGSLCGLTFFFGWGVASLLRLSADYRTAFGFSLGMKNTGLALVLVTLTLPTHRVAQLTIILFTLLQHVVAAIYARLISRSPESHPSDREQQG